MCHWTSITQNVLHYLHFDCHIRQNTERGNCVTYRIASAMTKLFPVRTIGLTTCSGPSIQVSKLFLDVVSGITHRSLLSLIFPTGNRTPTTRTLEGRGVRASLSFLNAPSHGPLEHHVDRTPLGRCDPGSICRVHLSFSNPGYRLGRSTPVRLVRQESI